MYKYYQLECFPIIAYKKPQMLNDKLLISKKKKTNLKKKNLEENIQYIEDFFYDINVMYSIASYVQWLIYEQSIIQRLEYIPIISQYKTIFSCPSEKQSIKKGVYGYVKQHCLCNTYRVILKFVRKKIEPIVGISDITHEYIITTHGLNYLRQYCPNFCYSFGLVYTSNSEMIHIMEYINGLTLGKFLENNQSLIYQPSMGKLFLQMIIQIIGSLELAQDLLWFSHYDLHMDNILIRKLKKEIPTLHYPFKTFTIVLHNIELIIQYIDFGFSTITINSNIICGKNHINVFPEIGMYPFYVPSVDILKLITTLFVKFNEKVQNSSFNAIILRFIKYILDNFYQIEIDDKLIDLRFIGTQLYRTIYRSPTEFMLFLLSPIHKTFILNLFQLDSYPFEFLDEYKTNVSVNDDHKELINSHLQNSFQIHQIDISVTSPLKENNSNQNQNIQLQPIKYIVEHYEFLECPLLHTDYISDIQAYCEEKSEWSIFSKNVEAILFSYKVNQKISANISSYFKNNLNSILRLYYTYKTLSFFIHYLKDQLKLNIL